MTAYRFFVAAGSLSLAASCGSTPKAPVADAAPISLPMHVVVNSSSVWMYINAADLVGCPCNGTVFPDPGNCFRGGDANTCSEPNYLGCTSCITDFGVEQAGVRLTPRFFSSDPRVLGFDVAITDAPLAIVLEGCGHPSTRIPIDANSFPSATVSADYTTAGAHVSWTTDSSPLEALVTMYPGPNDFAGETCFVVGTTDYTSTEVPDASSVAVQPLGSRVEVETEFGHATIWRGGAANTPFPH